MQRCEVFAFTPTRAASAKRKEMLHTTLQHGVETAGCAVDWKVCDGSRGQHVAWNEAHTTALEGGYRYFLRVDDDCVFKTKRWLRKLLDASVTLDDKMILSPLVRGLKRPPPRSEECEVNGVVLQFLTAAIGGVCRLHPMHLIDGYTSDVRQPMGAGDAIGMGEWCRNKLIPMAYVKHIQVRHDTSKQEDEDGEHFSYHDIFQCIPYIPPHSG